MWLRGSCDMSQGRCHWLGRRECLFLVGSLTTMMSSWEASRHVDTSCHGSTSLFPEVRHMIRIQYQVLGSRQGHLEVEGWFTLHCTQQPCTSLRHHPGKKQWPIWCPTICWGIVSLDFLKASTSRRLVSSIFGCLYAWNAISGNWTWKMQLEHGKM